jgi:hypothetical protein
MSKPDIYAAFDKATNSFSASALILNGKVAGRIVIKFGAAATAYVQVWGVEMASGRATGYGYDKASAAVEAAVAKLRLDKANERDDEGRAALAALLSAFSTRDDGARYTSRLEAAGFTLANVI